MKGRDSVHKVLEWFKSADSSDSQRQAAKQHHGTVIENFTTPPTFHKCVEVIAGNQ